MRGENVHFDANDKLQPYQTKMQRIVYLEAVMLQIEAAGTLEEAQSYARACRRTDRRWRVDSPHSFEELKKCEEAGG